MKSKRKNLSLKHKAALASLKRSRHHPIVHQLHRKHRISYKTLFYMKEYGPKSHVSHVIIRESIMILALTSFLSSLGGIGIESIESKLIMVLPLLIMLPALDDMIGDFGATVSSKFTTLLYLKEARFESGHRPFEKSWWKSREINNLLTIILAVSLISSIYIAVASNMIALSMGYALALPEFFRILIISIVTTISLVAIIFLISVVGGIFIYRRGEDPNNFLIPLTTSIADICSMLVLAGMVVWLL
ncbi:MAG: magnesium transporter [Candidatus Aenigmarchaeota archaeon]|nr:magnesium transporter [Candidatus Aenigmarchaeota archaeon]